jgi:hypothetical protein
MSLEDKVIVQDVEPSSKRIVVLLPPCDSILCDRVEGDEGLIELKNGFVVRVAPRHTESEKRLLTIDIGASVKYMYT